jgi:hypothetical protein
MVEVVLADGEAEDFLDDGQEVSQRTDGGEGWRFGWAKETAGRSENQRVFYGDQRDASLIKVIGQEAVVTANGSGSAWR